MEKCNWTSKLYDEKCSKPKWESSGFCLFHKPNKDQRESKLFWEVININYFQFLPQQLLPILKAAISFTSDAYDQYPELFRISATGTIQIELNSEQSISLGSELRKARNQYVLTSFNQSFAVKVLELYDIAHLHGNESGLFIGFVFPHFTMQFNYIVNESGMRNSRSFAFYEAKFEGFANFENYDFGSYDVIFNSCQFDREISFSNAKFNKAVNFDNCNLNTQYGFIGKLPFSNALFSGEFLHFKGGSLCSLYGIKLSEYTDLIIDEDVEIPDELRNVGTSNFTKKISDEIYTIAKKQAERTGNISLLQKYDENLRKFRFNYSVLLDDLIEIATVLQKRIHTRQIEDLYNDFYKDALAFKGYRVLDQTRAGSSDSSKTAGELDIEICNEFGIPFSILEAFRLSSLQKDIIVTHINKLLHKYDTSGHEKNVVIAYCELEKFDELVSSYELFIKNDLNTHGKFQKMHLVNSISQIATEKTDIRVIECKHIRENKIISVYHIMIKIKIKKK
jgi:hypothetical protein